ncbi:MAG TPA: hypothetical protein VFH38_06505 [Jatrophihabitans sp.]|nr:hypothetical protein [Jatrophihabitans sp.]
MTPESSPATAARKRSVVFVHVGEPKSGTTFLQETLWGNRAALARQGVQLPGLHAQEHFRANLDLREVPQDPHDPAGSYQGEWELLAAQATRAESKAIISHEQLAGATRRQAERALKSLDPAEVHIVLTVRDFASLLPAEWQETVKHRNVLGWQRWVRRVVESRPEPNDTGWDGESRRWFWQVHDTLDVLRRWSQGIPPERVHVVTVPRRGSSPTLLWERFASVIGIDPGSVDLSVARPNASLGLAETELLRRLNLALRRGDPVPDWFYAEHVKDRLAHDVLSRREASARPRLAPSQARWAMQCAEQMVAGLAESGYHVVGDLDELRSNPAGARRGRVDSRKVAPKAVADAAVVALAAVLRDQYTNRRSAGEVVPHRMKRLAREFTARSNLLRRVRVTVWRLGEKARSRSRR